MNFNFNYQLPLILQFKINQQWALGTPHSISACSTFWFTQKDLKWLLHRNGSVQRKGVKSMGNTGLPNKHTIFWRYLEVIA